MACRPAANPGSVRLRTSHVVIHSTRGGQPYGREYDATINYFANPSTIPNAHRVVGYDGRECTTVPDQLIANHAREWNAFSLGIELEQPFYGDAFSDAQLARAAAIVAQWSLTYGIPVDRERIRGHDEIPPGVRDGKTDPGPGFPWPRFLQMVQDRIAPPEPRQEPVNVALVGGLLLIAAAIGAVAHALGWLASPGGAR